MKLDFDVVIIGSGVSGMTAAIYLKRAGISCCLIEKNIYGGQVNISPKIKNYPAFVEISGMELSSKIFEQVKQLKIEYINSTVQKIDFSNDIKKVMINEKNINCKYIIIATGRHARKLNVEGSKKLVGKGLSYCATCDGNFFKKMDVIVIGGGNSALEEALYLSNICKTVTIINRSNKLRGEKYYIEKVNNTSNINIKYNSVVKEFKLENEKLNSVILEVNNIEEEIYAKGCFTYIGYEPTTEFIEKINLDEDGYIIVNSNNKTNVDKVYAIGDVVKKPIFQIITAMNDAVIATNSIINEINIKK